MESLLTPVLVVGAVFALGAVLLRMQRSGRGSGSALGPFLRHFEAEGVPAEIAAAVYRQLLSWMEAQDRSHAVRPEQELEAVYGLVPEEAIAALDRMARNSGRRREPTREIPELVTVADLVRELSRCPPEEGEDP